MNEKPGLIGVATAPRDLEEAESRGFWKGYISALVCVGLWLLLFWSLTRI
jgi:hypothetical protein